MDVVAFISYHSKDVTIRQMDQKSSIVMVHSALVMLNYTNYITDACLYEVEITYVGEYFKVMP